MAPKDSSWPEEHRWVSGGDSTAGAGASASMDRAGTGRCSGLYSLGQEAKSELCWSQKIGGSWCSSSLLSALTLSKPCRCDPGLPRKHPCALHRLSQGPVIQEPWIIRTPTISQHRQIWRLWLRETVIYSGAQSQEQESKFCLITQ